MFWDIAIALVAAGLTLRMAWVGVHVSLHPPDTEEGRSRKSIKVEFIVLAVASLALIVVQAYRSSKAYADLMAVVSKNERPTVGLSILQLKPIAQLLKPNQEFIVLMGMKVVGQDTARNMRCYELLFSLPGRPSRDQTFDARAKLKTALAEQPETGEDQLPGSECYKELTLKPSAMDISELINAGVGQEKRIIYAMAHADWENDAGADFHLDVCKYMESPTSELVQNPGWHQCP